MSFLIPKAYCHLLRFELPVIRGDFARLLKIVNDDPVRIRRTFPETVSNLCSAIDTACLWYWKQVLCLQRSAATVCLLKSYGVPAELVIGVRQIPFKAHAWVELNAKVINDKPYMREIYAVFDQC
jgi:hypothetical protein